MPHPEVLVVVRPPVREPKGPLAAKLAGAPAKCVGQAEEYRRMASEVGCPVFDAGSVTGSSVVDGIHLDPQPAPPDEACAFPPRSPATR
jgi:hypothetical protein